MRERHDRELLEARERCYSVTVAAADEFIDD